MNDTKLREQMCRLAKSMFDCGLTQGSTGNISARTEGGSLLVAHMGTSFGQLDPAWLSRFDVKGRQIDRDLPTKEAPLHPAFYNTRHQTGAAISRVVTKFDVDWDA